MCTKNIQGDMCDDWMVLRRGYKSRVCYRDVCANTSSHLSPPQPIMPVPDGIKPGVQTQENAIKLYNYAKENSFGAL